MNVWAFCEGVAAGFIAFFLVGVIALCIDARRDYGTFDGWLGRPRVTTQLRIARRCLIAIRDASVSGRADSIFVTEAQAFKAWACDALAAMEFGESAVRTPGGTAMQHIEEIRKTVK
jgi:hypothetical protein